MKFFAQKPVGAAARVSEYFSSDDYRRGYPEGIESHFWNIARNDALALMLATAVDKNQLILDVGCGTGVSVRFLSRRGYRCRGVEAGQVSAPADVADLIDAGRSVFDLSDPLRAEVRVVLLLDVLEHIERRREFLNRLREALPNCHSVIITVPARPELWGDYDRHWGHHLRYSRPQLVHELSDAGYRTVRVGYLFHAIYLLAIGMKALGIKRKVAFAAPGKTWPARLVHRVLGAWGKLENRLVPGCVVGSSIICHATCGADDDSR